MRLRILAAFGFVLAMMVVLALVLRHMSLDFLWGALTYAMLFHVLHRVSRGAWYGEEHGDGV